MDSRTYKGHTVFIYGGLVCGYTYEIDGKLTKRGFKGSTTRRSAWKAAKSEISKLEESKG